MPRTHNIPQHTLCPACGHRIVQATTTDGRRLALDTGLRSYRLVAEADNVTFRAEASGGYPVHACRGESDRHG
jgi:hypothetical protein